MNRKTLLGLMASTVLMAACTSTCGVDTSSVAPGSKEDFAINVPNTIYFDFDKSTLSAAAKKRVETQACWLKTYSCKNATIEGATDIRGTAEYNMALGETRANSVKKELETQGIEGTRLTTVSYGKERLIDTGTTEMAHAKNRRATTVIND